MYFCFRQSPKFKRVSLDKTPEFPSRGLNICVDFDFKDSKKIKDVNKLNKMIFHHKNILTKLPNPIRETRVLKLDFRTISCLKFWAQEFKLSLNSTEFVFIIHRNQINYQVQWVGFSNIS